MEKALENQHQFKIINVFSFIRKKYIDLHGTNIKEKHFFVTPSPLQFKRINYLNAQSVF